MRTIAVNILSFLTVVFALFLTQIGVRSANAEDGLKKSELSKSGKYVFSRF